jgi:hypothetical protein
MGDRKRDIERDFLPAIHDEYYPFGSPLGGSHRLFHLATPLVYLTTV